MRVKLLRQSRITHKAGEIVEVSPAEAKSLISLGSAVEIVERAEEIVECAEEIETPENPAPTQTRRTTKKG